MPRRPTTTSIHTRRFRRCGRARSFGPRHVHEVVNESAAPAVSIHAYSPPLAGMRRYELTRSGLVLAAVETAGERW